MEIADIRAEKYIYASKNAYDFYKLRVDNYNTREKIRKLTFVKSII